MGADVQQELHWLGESQQWCDSLGHMRSVIDNRRGDYKQQRCDLAINSKRYEAWGSVHARCATDARTGRW